MSAPHTFYITTPIYYVNDVPHIGHAYTTIAADVLARFYATLYPYEVFFLTGVDEHGQKVQQAAAKAGIDPQSYCNGMVSRYRNLWKQLNISNDAFIRTTDQQHKELVQEFLSQLHGKKLIYKADYEGWYCTFDERFWTEKDVENGLCPDCKRPVEQLKESNYFFKMGDYQKQLQHHILQHYNPPDSFIGPPSRCNEVLGFLRKPLGDLSISRPKSRLSWGIELPFDNGYVTYVWFDALVNYISALKYLTSESQKDPEASFKHYWSTHNKDSAPSSHFVTHLVGKDILTTHAVYWSTMLMALDIPLPTTIFAHGWWTVEGEKMSKSRGNVVDPCDMVERFGVDALRYFLLREVPFGEDGDFSHQALINRVNSELADGFGNLLSRTVTMIERYADGKIPLADPSIQTLEESQLGAPVGEKWAEANDHIRQLRFSRALETLWEVLQSCDQYIEKNAPWSLARDPATRPQLERVLYNVARTLAGTLPWLYPFIPDKTVEAAKQLGLNPRLEGRRLVLQEFKPGLSVTKGAILFPRIDLHSQGAKTVSDATTPPQPSIAIPTPIPAMPQTAAPTAPMPSTPVQITIDEFMKIQLKIARIVSAERVPKSEKLLKLQVTVGTEQRQIVAGIGKKYEPEALIGKTIVIVANLKPAKLMGIESQGMVLAAGDSDVRGLITLLEDVEPGTKVK